MNHAYFFVVYALLTMVATRFDEQIKHSNIIRYCTAFLCTETRKTETLSSKEIQSQPRAALRLKKSLSSAAQKIGLLFTAAAIDEVRELFRWTQPNCNGAVGPKQYVLITNQQIRSFDKSTGKPDNILDTDATSFFGMPAWDVRICYDIFSKMWLLSCEANDFTDSEIYNLVLAVSIDSIITKDTKWVFFTLTNALVNPLYPRGSTDYQQLAFDAHAVYICVSTYNEDPEPLDIGTSALVIEKRSLLAGSPLITVFPGLLPGGLKGVYGEYIPAADNFDSDPAYGYMVSSKCSFYGSGKTYNEFFLYRIKKPWSGNPELGPVIKVPTPDYAEPGFAPHKGNIYGAAGYLQTFLGAFAAPHIRNRQLYVVKDSRMDRTGKGTPHGDRIGIQWAQYDLTGDLSGRGRGKETPTTVPVLVQAGTIFDPGVTDPKWFFSPSIMTNKKGDLVISGTVAGRNTYIDVFYAGRKAKDPANTLREPVFVTHNRASYNYGAHSVFYTGALVTRWGDLGSLSLDPTSDDIWLTNESVDAKDKWGVTVAQLQPTV